MKRQSLLTKTKSLLSNIPLAGWLIGGGVIAVVAIYSLIFLVPRSVTFSYGESTCAPALTVAPQLHKATSDQFEVALTNTVQIGSVQLFSTTLCVTPKEALSKGVAGVTVAPFGGIVARQQYKVTIPDSPQPEVSAIAGRQISTSEPLAISLTSADVIHRYSLAIADKKTECQQANGELSCNVERLELNHGTTYTASLHQTYKQVDKKVLEGEVETLQPLVLTGGSVSEGAVIYDAPEEFSLTFDQPLKQVQVELMRVEGESEQTIPVEVTTGGQTAQVSVASLPRDTAYRLIIKRAIAESGSSLAAPVTLSFTMSGGPKVVNVSVGAVKVARSAAITVTLDQPMASDTNVGAVARVEGVAGSVRKKSDTQLIYTIQGGDCSAFKLILDKGVKSGVNDQASKEQWVFNSRTICGSSWSIGASVQGRSIPAYSFGSGSKVILMTGGIHGSEPSSTTTMQALVSHYQSYGYEIPADKRLVIVPNTNPDGIARGTRYNANNVNLGRNFPTKNWSASIETSSGTQPTGGGTSAGSEPEAAALIKLVRQLKPRVSISYHARGSLVGANKFADSVAIGDTYAKTVGYRTMYYNAEAVMGYPMTGEMEDWMGEEMNIPAILIELPQHSGNYLNSQLPAIKKMLAI